MPAFRHRIADADTSWGTLAEEYSQRPLASTTCCGTAEVPDSCAVMLPLVTEAVAGGAGEPGGDRTGAGVEAAVVAVALGGEGGNAEGAGIGGVGVRMGGVLEVEPPGAGRAAAWAGGGCVAESCRDSAPSSPGYSKMTEALAPGGPQRALGWCGGGGREPAEGMARRHSAGPCIFVQLKVCKA